MGAAIFIVALTGSALVVPELRLLHFFQALIYVAVVVLAWRGRACGYGAGVSVPVFWNGLQLFITHNVQAGAVELSSFVRTGQGRRFDTMMVPLGAILHFILIISCLAVFFGSARGRRAYGEFLGGAVLALAYFGAIVAALSPR